MASLDETNEEDQACFRRSLWRYALMRGNRSLGERHCTAHCIAESIQ
ncbi:hypothetical protein RESH_02700 [Rhodopirellula europaea SH398]|uniref:Uncharacterized protein n=1 Tax=Rhodopirellula europaea SH398 TaxID=1263868 RepID=M5SGI7_9BACT|nr:hypothetical protein RESH_02700 [Rhodopirellula europaea SH398]